MNLTECQIEREDKRRDKVKAIKLWMVQELKTKEDLFEWVPVGTFPPRITRYAAQIIEKNQRTFQSKRGYWGPHFSLCSLVRLHPDLIRQTLADRRNK